MTTQFFDDLDCLLTRGQSDLAHYLSDGFPHLDGYSNEEIDNLHSLKQRSYQVIGLATKLVNNSYPVLVSEIVREVDKAILVTGKAPEQVIAFNTVLTREDYEALLPEDVRDRLAQLEQRQRA